MRNIRDFIPVAWLLLYCLLHRGRGKPVNTFKKTGSNPLILNISKLGYVKFHVLKPNGFSVRIEGMRLMIIFFI